MRRCLAIALLLAPLPALAQEPSFFEDLVSLAKAMPGFPIDAARVDGNIVDQRYVMNGASMADVFSPGPSDCSVIQTLATQDPGDWAKISVTTFDFAKISGYRWLGDEDDLEKAAGRQPDDPKVSALQLDGAWKCQRVIHLTQSPPYFANHCEGGWYIALVDENKKAAREVWDRVEKACLKK